MEKAQDRLEVLQKIREKEIARDFNTDVENDPPAYELLPNKVDYLNKKLSSKFMNWLVNKKATAFFENLIKNKQFIIKEVKGIDNFLAVKSGAIITSNHFHPFENYAVWRAIKPYMKGKNLYKVIKEGNFTNPPPAFKQIMLHCNTLPLSRNRETMKKFLSAVDILLSRGEKILVYPEQAMWWNYRKPRPFKNGAFKFAISSNVPVIPFFITMNDSDIIGADGFPVQEYTVNILPAIYPDNSLSKNENADMMRDKNYEAWKQTYEEFYKIPLKYEN